jgi:hypothetical protein
VLDNYLGDFLSHHVKPVQEVCGHRTHLQLELPERVVAIREKRDLLVHQQTLRLQHLIQTSLGFGLQRLHKPKALMRRGLGIFILAKAQTLLPTMTSKFCCLSHQWRTYPPSMPTVKAPSGCGKRTQSLGLPSVKQGGSSPNSLPVAWPPCVCHNAGF